MDTRPRRRFDWERSRWPESERVKHRQVRPPNTRAGGPQAPDRRYARLTWWIVAALVLGSLTIAVTVGRHDETPAVSNAQPPLAATPTVGDAAAALPSPTAATQDNSPPPSGTPAPASACRPACLIRLPEPAVATRQTLERSGFREVYAFDGVLWGTAPSTLLDELIAGGTRVTVVTRGPETLPLYVVRLPDGGDEAAVREIGRILDQAGNQFIVRVPELPPPVAALSAAGIWIEKIPPPSSSSTAVRSNLAPPSDLGRLASGVSVDELSTTIQELQAMGTTQGNLGTRHYATSGNAMAAEYLYRRFSGLGLRVWYEDFVADGGSYAVNVVGELPGTDPSKVYLIVAHYDSMTDGVGPAPGADDNASGVAAMIEIARVLAQYQLAHPVRFVALTAEEAALQGANAFVNRAATDGTPYAAAFNLDALGSSGRDHQLVINSNTDAAWLQDVLVEINDTHAIGQDLVLRQNPAIVSDDNVLRDAGIPAVLVTRGVYGENRLHHTLDDTLANLDLHGVETATQLVLLSLAMLVESD